MMLNEMDLIKVLTGAHLRKEVDDNAVSLRWAVVTNVYPLEAIRVGESEDFTVTGTAVPLSMLRVGDTVRVSNFGSKAFIESSPDAAQRHSSWISEPTLLTLSNGWVNYSLPSGGYSQATLRLKSDGFAYLDGLVKDGVVNAPILVLPEGTRPEKNMIFPGVSNAGYCRIDVFSSGEIRQVGGTSNGYVSLNGFSWPVFVEPSPVVDPSTRTYGTPITVTDP